MDFLNLLLDQTKTTENDESLRYMEYILRQDLIKYEETGGDTTATETQSSYISPARGRLGEVLGETSYSDFEGVEDEGDLTIYHRGDTGPTSSRANTIASVVPSTGLVTYEARTTTVPSTEALHSAVPMKAAPGKPDTGGPNHVVRVPVASAVTICIFVEVFVFAFMLVFVIVQVRRMMKNRGDVPEKVVDDIEKGNGSDDFSSGVSCSTSTPNSRRGSVYPGLCSALSENLHYMLSPIDSQGQGMRSSFSCSHSVPIDVKPKQIQGCLSEERQRSSTWLDFSPESKRALYSMSRSRSTPEHLAARASMSSSSDVVETHIGRLNTGIYKREELAAKFVGKWRQKKGKKEISKLTFKVTYDSEIELLTVFVDSVLNLPQPVKDGNGDVFVKIALDPDHKRRSMNSSIRHGTRSPEFKQNFSFRIARGAVNEMRIKFTVCEYDQYSHPIAIGCIDFALSEHELDQGADVDDKVIQRDLEKPEKEEDEALMGDLMISLTYLPNAERVNLIIMKARNIRLPEWGDMEVGRSILDTFVKITIMRCGKVMKHKNTKVVRRSCSPVFNEAFSIDRMRLSEMPECCFVLSVCTRINHFRSHRIIGRCVVGGKDCAVGDGLAHWNEMSDTPRSIVARWHKIQR
ncbi:synaptotagmin-5-like [Strongylocentrotus purpuratus]|uniref:C2 domain-containing protein n=1 Tax=Strongylocentrotus purpuratus TaxID=7668 RepID=A0A7M7NGD2_STRPU|nr:synaptotagmin-5-like [Strongylocentrotus purpuratus]